MRGLDSLKKEIISYLFSSEQADVCVQIVDMLGKYECAQLRMLTYQAFSREIRRPLADPALVLAIHFFVNTERFKLLDKHYLVLDSDLSSSFEISDEDAAEALRTGLLPLPSGEEVGNVEEHLLPYFSASRRLMEIKGTECQAN